MVCLGRPATAGACPRCLYRRNGGWRVLNRPVGFILLALLSATPFWTASAFVDVTLPDVATHEGEAFTQPVLVEDLTGLDVIAATFEIQYDPNRVTATGIDTVGTLAQGWFTATNVLAEGRIRIPMANATPAEGAGVFINVLFQALAGSAGEITLTVSQAVLNTSPASSVTVGSVIIQPSLTGEDPISTQITVKTTPAGHSAVWNMIAPPVEPVITRIDDSTFGELGVYSAQNWLAFRWNSALARYEQPEEVGGTSKDEFRIGKAWFVAADEPQGGGDLTLTVTGIPAGTSTRTVIPITGSIQQPRWTMVGNPYNFAFRWSDATVQVRQTGGMVEYTPTQADGDQLDDGGGIVDWIDNTAFAWNPSVADWERGESDDQTLVIAPGQGFFLLSAIEGELLFTPEEAGQVASAGAIRPIDTGAWGAQLVATSGDQSDAVKMVVARSGVLSASSTRKPPPTPMAGSVRVVLRKRISGRDASAQRVAETTPIRRSPWTEYETLVVPQTEELAWDVEIYALEGAELRWDAWNLPDDVDLSLREAGASRPVDLRVEKRLRVDASDGWRRFVITARGRSASTQVFQDRLLPNYPNPFNPETWIPFELNEPANVTVTVYDTLGQAVRRVELGHRAPGVYRTPNRAVHWDGRNDQGERVAGGAYFVELRAGDARETRRIVLAK